MQQIVSESRRFAKVVYDLAYLANETRIQPCPPCVFVSILRTQVEAYNSFINDTAMLAVVITMNLQRFEYHGRGIKCVRCAVQLLDSMYVIQVQNEDSIAVSKLLDCACSSSNDQQRSSY